MQGSNIFFNKVFYKFSTPFLLIQIGILYLQHAIEE